MPTESRGGARPRRGSLGLERTMPLTRLPSMIAQRQASREGTMLGRLPLERFSPRLIDEVLRPATGAMVDRVVSDLEDHTDLDLRGGEVETLIREAVEDALDQFSEAVTSGRMELDQSLFYEIGRRHARAGLPLSELTAMVGHGGLACWRGVLELHQDGHVPDDLLLPASEVVFAFAQELSAAAVEGYADALSAAGTAVRSRRVELVRRLLDGGDLELDEVQAQAEAVGWRLPDQLAIALVASDQRPSMPSQWPDDVLVAPQGARLCLVLPAPGGQRRAVPALPDALVGVGPVVAWDRAPASAEYAESLLTLAAAGVIPPAGVLEAGEYGIELMLTRHGALAADIVRTQLGPLLELPESRREPLLETLAAWVQRPGQLTALAEDLHVHVRTVRYRVGRLRELLGDRVDDPERRLLLALSVRALRPDTGIGRATAASQR